jgi:hypothetical protein
VPTESIIACIDFGIISFLPYHMNPVIIHDQCSDFELVSPVYFGHNIIWRIPPDQKVDANTATSVSFGRDVTKDESAGALIYKLQRKSHKSNNQSGMDSTSTEDTLTSLQLLVIWKSVNKCIFSARALLIKHSNVITWDKDTLKKLHSMHLALCKEDHIIEDTWLLDDATVLVTTLKWKKDRDEITISKGTRKDINQC